MATRKKTTSKTAARSADENLAMARASLSVSSSEVPAADLQWLEPAYRGWLFTALRTPARDHAIEDVRTRAPSRAQDLLYTVTTLLRALPELRGSLQRVEELAERADPARLSPDVQIVAAAGRAALGDPEAFEKGIATIEAYTTSPYQRRPPSDVVAEAAFHLATWGWDPTETLARHLPSMSDPLRDQAAHHLARRNHPALAAAWANLEGRALAQWLDPMVRDAGIPPSVRAELAERALTAHPSQFDYGMHALVKIGDKGFDLAEARSLSMPDAAKPDAWTALAASPRGEAHARAAAEAIAARPADPETARLWCRLAAANFATGRDHRAASEGFLTALKAIDPDPDSRDWAVALVGSTDLVTLPDGTLDSRRTIVVPRATLLSALEILPRHPTLLHAALETEGPENEALRAQLREVEASAGGGLSQFANGDLALKGTDLAQATQLMEASFEEMCAKGTSTDKGLARQLRVLGRLRLGLFEGALEAAGSVSKNERGGSLAAVAIAAAREAPELSELAATQAEKLLSPIRGATMRVRMARVQLGDSAFEGAFDGAFEGGALRHGNFNFAGFWPRPHPEEAALATHVHGMIGAARA